MVRIIPNIRYMISNKYIVGLVSMVSLFVVITGSAWAQYSQEWAVVQDPYEIGNIYFDLNQDGYQELTKQLYNTVTVYNGTNSYEIIWSLVAANHDELILWDVIERYNGNDTVAVVMATNYIEDLSTQVMAYPVLGQSPLWDTSDLPGYYSNMDADNLDEDPQKEIVVGVNDYNPTLQTYSSKFYIINSLNGAIEFQSETFDGFMIGPYLGDLDGDNIVEILVNLYHSDSTSTLRVFSYEAADVNEIPQIPDRFTIEQNYPNPFNSATTIPLTLTKTDRVKITIVDVQGRMVNQLLDGTIGADFHPWGVECTSTKFKSVITNLEKRWCY